MTDPITGPLATPRLGTATDNARQSTDTGLARQGAEGGASRQSVPPAPAAVSQSLAAPAVRLAAELLRLDPGLVLDALMGGPDEAGRPTIVTNAGLFAVTGENPSLPPPGAPLSVEVIRSGELLSVLLRGASARGAIRAFDLQYLGSTPPPEGSEPAPARSLFQAVQVMAEGGRQFSLAVHLAGARASENSLPAMVTARQPRPDGTVTLTLQAADGSRVTIADAPPAIATGTRLLLEVVSRQPVAAGPRAPVVQSSQPTLAGAPPVIQEFAAGRDAVSALAPLLAAAGEEIPALARVLPGLAQEDGQALPVALLGAALRFKDFRRLIGPEREARVLTRGGPGPLLRAGAAFTEFARAATEDAPSGWRAVPLPFFDGREITPIVLFVSRQPAPEDQATGDEESARRQAGGDGRARFVVQVELSQLGPLQIDGFSGAGRIDTLLRSRRALAPDLCRVLVERYTAVLAGAGLAGTLGFQVEDNPLGTLEFGSERRRPSGGGISIEA